MPEPAAGGATPPAGATPPPGNGNPQPPANPPTPPPATGDDALGDAGKRAIKAERDARAAAERERDEFKSRLEALENASKSESQRAIDEAKKTGAAEATKAAEARIRRSEIRRALTAAGIQSSELDLAARADDFGELKVTDAGDLEGLDEVVSAFKKAHPALFAPSGPTGSIDQGARGKPALTLDQVRGMKPAEINARWAEIEPLLAQKK